MIKAILFDVDGVLIDSFDANLKYYQDGFAQTEYSARNREEYKVLNHLTVYDQVCRIVGRENKSEVDRVLKIFDDTPYDFSLVKFPPNLREVIKKSSSVYKLGIVTGRDRVGLREFYEHSALGDYFSCDVCFEDYKNPKPHPEPLLLALKKLRVNPKEAVFIGDAPTDFQCAQAVGAGFIKFGNWKFDGPKYRTKDFLDIPELVKKM